MKKILFTFLTAFLFLPFVNAAKKEPVKVYIFEAGGCPYCEAETEYLESLSSYGTKFVIVSKEAYIDHIDWEPGKDYDLAKKVSDAFNAAGFDDATYQATPFVVISDLYAASAYNTDLESIINQAYEDEDKDIVTCIESGKTDCLSHLSANTNTSNSNSNGSIIAIILCSAVIICTYWFKSSKNTQQIIEAIEKNSKRK